MLIIIILSFLRLYVGKFMESCLYGKENQQKKYKNDAFSIRFRLFNAFLCKKMLIFASENQYQSTGWPTKVKHRKL